MGKTSATTRWWRRTIEPAASGIFTVRTAWLRRSQLTSARRKLPRPPLRLNLSLLLLAILGGTAALAHRQLLDQSFATLVKENASAPFEIQRIHRDLADWELDEKSLSTQLDARLQYLESLKSEEFYISIDRTGKRFSFRYGDKTVRETNVEIGTTGTIRTRSGERWTFVPLTGAFNVQQKAMEPTWNVPEWAYWIDQKTPPNPLPAIRGGLGKYVVVLSSDYVIHSPPPPDSPLKGPKPGSFMVPEADLAAIWRRLGPQTRVYVF